MKRLLVLLAVLGMVAAACGSGSSEGTSGTGEGSEGTEASSDGTEGSSDETTGDSEASGYGVDFDEDLEANEEYEIGVSLQQQKANFWVAVKEGSTDAGTRAGTAEPFFADANNDDTKQLDDVANMIVEEFDGIVLGATNSVAAESIVAETKEAGIPVIAVALQVGDPEEFGANAVHPDTIGLVTNDDVEMGATAATFVEQVSEENGGEELNIVVLEGTPGAANTTLRGQGFTEALDEKGIAYDISNTQTGKFKREEAEVACQNMLAGDDEIDLIYSQSDEMTIGCVIAMEDAGRDIPIASIGGNEEGIKLVEEGKVLGTVCQKPATMGAVATQLLVKHLNGDDIGDEVFFYETPAITADNLADCEPEW